MTTDDRQQAAILALLRQAKPKHAAQLLEDHDNDVLRALESITIPDQMSLTDEPAEGRLDEELQQATADLAGWREAGIDAVTVLDDRYPPNLRLVHDRPLLLFVGGALQPQDERSVAVVGTRKASERGLNEARQMSTGLVEAGYVVVSGLAEGVDTAAHRAALDAGGRTIAVIGTGLNHSFPAANAALQQHLVAHTAVISQFLPDQGPRRHTFPMRNAVMSGFARATVVIEASRTSGAKMQARLALEHGRPVFLMSTLLEHEWARGYADRPGVFVVDDVAEVVPRLDRLYAAEVNLVL